MKETFHLLFQSPNGRNNQGLDLHPGLPCGWQRPSYLDHHPWLSKEHSEEAGSKAEYPGLSILVWDASTTRGSLTHCASVLAPIQFCKSNEFSLIVWHSFCMLIWQISVVANCFHFAEGDNCLGVCGVLLD